MGEPGAAEALGSRAGPGTGAYPCRRGLGDRPSAGTQNSRKNLSMLIRAAERKRTQPILRVERDKYSQPRPHHEAPTRAAITWPVDKGSNNGAGAPHLRRVGPAGRVGRGAPPADGVLHFGGTRGARRAAELPETRNAKLSRQQRGIVAACEAQAAHARCADFAGELLSKTVMTRTSAASHRRTPSSNGRPRRSRTTCGGRRPPKEPVDSDTTSSDSENDDDDDVLPPPPSRRAAVVPRRRRPPALRVGRFRRWCGWCHLARGTTTARDGAPVRLISKSTTVVGRTVAVPPSVVNDATSLWSAAFNRTPVDAEERVRRPARRLYVKPRTGVDETLGVGRVLSASSPGAGQPAFIKFQDAVHVQKNGPPRKRVEVGTIKCKAGALRLSSSRNNVSCFSRAEVRFVVQMRGAHAITLVADGDARPDGGPRFHAVARLLAQ